MNYILGVKTKEEFSGFEYEYVFEFQVVQANKITTLTTDLYYFHIYYQNY